MVDDGVQPQGVEEALALRWQAKNVQRLASNAPSRAAADLVKREQRMFVGDLISCQGRRPVPSRNLADGMEIGICLRPRILLGDARAELGMGAHCRPEWLVIRQARFIKGLRIEGHEALPLLVGDLQMAVHVDHMLESKPAGEAVRAAERLGSEPGQVVDVMRTPLRG